MESGILAPLAAWESFYVIVGSAAAALTGLQFVVTVLGAESGIWSDSAAKAFGTPTIVHFGAVLLVSAILSAPWQTLQYPGFVLTVCGVIGLIYSLVIIWHARHQQDYQPVLEDWLWHFLFPLVAYAVLAGSGNAMRHDAAPALFMIGAAMILLLFIGIHNAWDSVTYIATQRRKDEK